MASIQEALNAALDHHQEGRTDEARVIYRCIMDVDPDNPHALHLFSLLKAQAGDHHEAADPIRKTIRRSHLTADFHGNLSKALQPLGPEAGPQAIAAIRNTVLLQPDSPVAWAGFANALLDTGDGATDGGREALAEATARSAWSIMPPGTGGCGRRLANRLGAGPGPRRDDPQAGTPCGPDGGPSGSDHRAPGGRAAEAAPV